MKDITTKSEIDRDAVERCLENCAIDDNRVDNMTPKRIMKNVAVLSVSFLLTFLSFGGLLILQSSLHRVAGMGTTTQSVLNACNVISCLFLPKLAIQKLGHKKCVSLAMIGYILWMAANGYAVWWTMVPASILVGVCTGSLWVAANSYITILGQQYAHKKGKKPEAVIPNFFGVFTMMIRIAGVFSNVISSTVLRQSPPKNYTGPSEEDLALCGINDCPSNNDTNNINLQKPAENLVWTLVGIYIALAIIGLFISIFFLDTIPAYLIDNKKENSIKDGLQATCRQMISPKQLLLIPLCIYVGQSQAFKIADWNKSFVTCNLGIWMVGYTSIAFYIANGAMSVVSGRLVKLTGRIPVFIFGMCLEVSMILTYIFWTPNPDEIVLFYVLPILSGMGDGIWHTQTLAIHGFFFKHNTEAAFSSQSVWKSVGFFLGFGYSSQLCMVYKLYALIICLTIAMLCYCYAEWMFRAEQAKSRNIRLEAENLKLNALKQKSSFQLG